ncbi:hypothetical protein [Gillisia hiemivivida]|uniref:CHRD domain-containing protein n=1 Tax=Gillisia hiemivivida TaxID=291190 RepID=A0A5C6ZVT4_9FLAO|nr:hypothetical protein [Gillisia hiemivivida]TXD94464.1 hypothetical protein ES724_05485 [Gillisia hiemivivida]
MKKLNYSLSFIAIIAMLFTSCSKEETSSPIDDASTESAVLTFGAMLDNLANRAMEKGHFDQVPDCSAAEPDMAEVTFSYPGSGGDKVVEVGISQDASGYFTEYSELLKIPIVQGTDFTKITLKGFKVFDAGDNLIWIAPVAPGDFSGYVDKPLPFDVDVYAGTKPYIDIEVLCFDRRMVNEYGYVFFDIDQKEIFNFCLFGNFCTPEGRHYVANYTIDVWTYDTSTETRGTRLYTKNEANSTSIATLNNGVYQESPLCVALPDDPDSDDDAYYFEITLLDSPEYDSDRVGTIIRSGVLTEFEAKTLFVGDDKLEYYHFMEGCDDDDTPPVFNDPTSNTTTYYACLRELNNSKVAAVAYVTLDGNTIKTQIAGFGLDNGLHPQHIHGKTDDSFDSTCPDMSADLVINGGNGNGLLEIGEGLSAYGGPQLFLTLAGAGDGTNSNFPVTTTGVLMYERTVTLGASGFPSMADMTPLDKKTIVLHGKDVGSDYIATLPIACGQLELN